MTITREARHLSPNDTGKTMTATDLLTKQTVTGEFYRITAAENSIELTIINGARHEVFLTYNDTVTITCTPTPPGLNLHKPVTDQNQ
ncbi:hypothetical protein [Glutamicibacter arilaitensis]|uniref:hypothetical protein n=1 Tax=Glutamicibacter arilaitensis TaxID=256701 RepID=UPI00384B65E8